ncbi:MAG: hypothetical protein ACQERN_03950 [Thermodesulfobacteriota bacterium]
MNPTIHQKQKLRIALCLLAAILLAGPLITTDAAAQSDSSGKTVISFGDSRIYKELSSAKNAAISQSLLSALQTTAADMLSQTELTENFETVTNVLTDHRDELVQGYKILKEMRTDRYYRVLIQTTINPAPIRQKLAEAGLRTGPDRLPSVIFMVAEKQLNDIGYQYWWRSGGTLYESEDAVLPMIEALSKEGLPVIEPQQAAMGGQLPHDGKKLDATPANHEAAKLAEKLGAELVVVGTATAKATANRMGENIRTYKGLINVRVLTTDTGEKLTTLRQQAVTGGEDPEAASANALSDAAYQAGRQLADRIVPLWEKTEQAEKTLTLSVSGKNILPHLEKFRQVVRNTKGVTKLQAREMTPDAATLRIVCESTPQELADNLILQSYDPFGINIAEVLSDGLKIELMPEQ